MSTHNKNLLLEISSAEYDQLTRIASLLESGLGIAANQSSVAAKLLSQSLAAWNKQGFNNEKKNKEHLSVGVAPNNPPRQSDIMSLVQAIEQDSIQGISSEIFAEHPDLSDVQIAQHFSEMQQGARIALIGDDPETLSAYLLRLAQYFAKEAPVVYIAPDCIGEFSQMLERFKISQQKHHRIKAIHYLPENATQWKRLICGSGKRMQYGTALFDSASQMQPDGDLMDLIAGAKPKGEPKQLTQVFSFIQESENPQHEIFASLTEKFQIVLSVLKDRPVTVIKNSFLKSEH